MVAHRVCPWRGHQRCQSGHQIERVEVDVGCAVAPTMPEAIEDSSVGGLGEALGGDGRPRHVASEPLPASGSPQGFDIRLIPGPCADSQLLFPMNLDLLARHLAGSVKPVWSVVRVPSVEDEDRRHLHRELRLAKKDRTRVSHRIKGLLSNQGLVLNLRQDLRLQLERMWLWDGSPLPAGLRGRLERYIEDYEYWTERIRGLEAERRRILREEEGPVFDKVRQLYTLKAVGVNTAWSLGTEFFGWRDFRNGKQVGSMAGLTPTPHDSGTKAREQGIGKDGSRWVRGDAIEFAWGWLRFQPESELSQWYQRRFGHGSKRLRKIGIVALARKLLVALWRFLETSVVPEGALLKTNLRLR